MTTAVTIDAHAGWDIEVMLLTSCPCPKGYEEEGESGWFEPSIQLVPAGTERTFYIHDDMYIGYIKEKK